VRDYADRPCPGASTDYLVVPRSLAQSMPLRWQQVFVALLADLHDAYRQLDWPVYQVVASRRELLTDLDEDQLAFVGYVADLDADGGLIFRDCRRAADPGRARHPGARAHHRPDPAGVGRSDRAAPRRRPGLSARRKIRRRREQIRPAGRCAARQG